MCVPVCFASSNNADIILWFLLRSCGRCLLQRFASGHTSFQVVNSAFKHREFLIEQR